LTGLLFFIHTVKAQQEDLILSDSVKIFQKVERLDSSLTLENARIDSMYWQSIVKINNYDSLLRRNIQNGLKYLNSTSQQLSDSLDFDKISSSIQDSLSRLSNRLSNITQLRKKLPSQINDSELLQNIKVPSLTPMKNLSIPKLDIPTDKITDFDISNYNLPSLNDNWESLGIGDYKKYLGDYDNLKNLQLNDKDIEKYVVKEVDELNALNNLSENTLESEAMTKINRYNKQLMSIVKKIQDPEGMKDEAKEKAIEEGVKLAQDYQNKISNAQKSLSKLKRKYSYVQSINDLSNAKKINSLADESFGQRLFFGSQFQVLRREPTGIDLSLFLGYKLNKRLHTGVSVNYRISVQVDSLNIKISDPADVYGASAFTDYVFFRSFFIRGEFESKNTRVFNEDDISSRKWVEGLFIGIGYEFKIYKKLKGGAIVQYNLLQSDDSPYRSPWQFKFGIFKK
jgi:hypothetical protein